VFLTQYASCREAKMNNHHLLSIKMRHSHSLKSYISFFQSQLVKIPNYSEDVSALAFISGLQVFHPLYKHLLNYVTRMSDIMLQVQPYIQLEEVMKTSFNHIAKHDGGGKLKTPHEASVHAQDRNQGQHAFKRSASGSVTKSALTLQANGGTSLL